MDDLTKEARPDNDTVGDDPMAYDRADWHYGGDYPEGLPPENGGTHIGMFLAWAITRGLEGEFHQRESAESVAAVRERRMTGREFLFNECDEKFWEEDLSEDGNTFAHAYYESEDDSWAYLTDYAGLLAADVPSLYHVADSWENFDRLAPIIDRRYAEWKERRS
jgi:hypothetical protein